MKLSAILVTFGNLVAAQDAIEEKKVPPRRPDQRLNTLKRFAENWIDSQLGSNLNRPQRAINKKRAFNRIFDRALEAYNKCGYFDPTVLPHGGPRPEGMRRRRDDTEDVFDDAELRYQDSTRGVLEVRLSNDPAIAFKQIRAGFKKWMVRYLGECPGQSNNGNHSGRTARIHARAQEAFNKLDDNYDDITNGWKRTL